MHSALSLPPRPIEVRGFRYPRRATSIARAWPLGSDAFGRWLGVRRGDPWRSGDGAQSGAFDRSFVKLVPKGTFWTACFHQVDPVVDVDISLPVSWVGEDLEEVDLELDVLRVATGETSVRDREKFAELRSRWGLPPDVANRAERTCQEISELVDQAAEPFGQTGALWLGRFLEALGER